MKLLSLKTDDGIDLDAINRQMRLVPVVANANLWLSNVCRNQNHYNRRRQHSDKQTSNDFHDSIENIKENVQVH